MPSQVKSSHAHREKMRSTGDVMKDEERKQKERESVGRVEAMVLKRGDREREKEDPLSLTPLENVFFPSVGNEEE